MSSNNEGSTKRPLLFSSDPNNIPYNTRMEIVDIHYDPDNTIGHYVEIIQNDEKKYKPILLGTGSFSTVEGYKMINNIEKLPKYFAIKTIDYDKIANKGILDNEIETLIKLVDSPVAEYTSKIYAIFDATHTGKLNRYIIMEWDPQGATLDNYVKILKDKGEYTVDEFNNIKELLNNAINKIHKQGVVHRDIKPGNIYISYNDDYSIKKIYILDFGLAVPINTEQNVVGTPDFTPRKTYRKSITREKHKYTRQNNMNSLLMTLNIIRPDGMDPLYTEPNNNSPGFKPREGSFWTGDPRREGFFKEKGYELPLGYRPLGGKRLRSTRSSRRSGRHRRSKSARRRRTLRK